MLLNFMMMSEEKDQQTNSTDIISDLPDSILTHILSFLTTKQALLTCILSKRWNKLWASVPILHFDFNEFLTEDAYNSYLEHERCEIKFHQFVNHVLQYRNVSKLDSFELFMENIKEHSDYSDATPWILHAIECKPQLLNVTICRLDFFSIPDSVFTCSSLESLQLSSEEYLRPKFVKPKIIRLPFLKKLRLASVTIDEFFLTELLLGCPSLETLKLAYCQLHFTKISSNTLRNLVIGECYLCEGNVEIEISSLESLLLVQNVDRFLLKNKRCLVDAALWGLKYGFCRSGIMDAVVNVSKLLLEGTPMYEDIKEKEVAIANFPIFNNLRDLSIGGWCIIDDFDLVASFLKNSPNLQNLTCFVKTEQSTDENMRKDQESSREAQRDMWYLRDHLNMIEIKRISDGGSVDELVKTLRACVKSIDKIIVI